MTCKPPALALTALALPALAPTLTPFVGASGDLSLGPK